MIIIKKEALSDFYIKREHRKNLVTKESVIALRQSNRCFVKIRKLFKKSNHYLEYFEVLAISGV